LPPDHDGRSPDYGFGLALRDGKALVNSLDEEISTGEIGGAAYFFDLGCDACPTDLDGDGALTLFDYLAFFKAFDAADPIADLDGDGEFTLLDFVAFRDAFDAGCD
ncbi:MAG: GC-type dockerin domain-anchored protein, partial [Planctomycetota bacterium]